MRLGSADRLACARFQSGLLTWLRAASPQDHAHGLREMIAVTRSLAGDGGSGGDRLLWRSAASFLQALLDGSLATDGEARALCRRLEKRLAGRGHANENADELAEAIFGFVSKRLAPAVPQETAGESAAAAPRGLDSILSGTLAATADILPLLGKAPRRISDPQLARWKAAAAALRRDWHEVQAGTRDDCRAAAIALLQVALELADPPSLRLAEALAEAGGVAEDRALRALPAFRAAFAAALECAEHAEGPDQKGFSENAVALAERLSRAASPPKGGDGLVCAGAPWFAEDAQEIIADLAAALDAVPPRRLDLLAGFDWFVQHEGGKAMAIRGLASLAHRILGRIRGADLDEPDNHATLGRAIKALQQAIDDIADGLPPKVDEAVFADLRALDRQIAEYRQQALAARATVAAPDTETAMSAIPGTPDTPLQ